MKTIVTFGAFLAVAAGATFFANREAVGQDAVLDAPANQGAARLLYAQPFELDQAWAYDWRADQPSVTSGTIVAVRGPQDLTEVKAIHHPLLFVGDTPVARLNGNNEHGIFIGFVPGTVDLTSDPMYWSQPDILPVHLTAEDGQAVLADAVASGATAPGEAELDAAYVAGGGTLYTETYGTLRSAAADVVRQFSPGEVDLIQGLELPPLVR